MSQGAEQEPNPPPGRVNRLELQLNTLKAQSVEQQKTIAELRTLVNDCVAASSAQQKALDELSSKMVVTTPSGTVSDGVTKAADPGEAVKTKERVIVSRGWLWNTYQN